MSEFYTPRKELEQAVHYWQAEKEVADTAAEYADEQLRFYIARLVELHEAGYLQTPDTTDDVPASKV